MTVNSFYLIDVSGDNAVSLFFLEYLHAPYCKKMDPIRFIFLDPMIMW